MKRGGATLPVSLRAESAPEWHPSSGATPTGCTSLSDPLCDHRPPWHRPHRRARRAAVDRSEARPSAVGQRSAARVAEEVGPEERLQLAVELELVLFVGESVALVVLDQVLHVNPPPSQSVDDLIGLCFLDPRVIRSLRDKERRHDLFGMKEGGIRPETFRVPFWKPYLEMVYEMVGHPET